MLIKKVNNLKNTGNVFFPHPLDLFKKKKFSCLIQPSIELLIYFPHPLDLAGKKYFLWCH